MIKKISPFLLLAVVLLSTTTKIQAQIENPIHWSIKTGIIENNKVELIIEASVDEGWHLYGTEIADGGPVPTSFFFEDSSIFVNIDKTIQVTKPIEKFDELFGINVQTHDKKAVFSKTVTLKSPTQDKLTIFADFMACNDNTCLPPTAEELSVKIPKLSTSVSQPQAKAEEKTTPITASENTNQKTEVAQIEVDTVEPQTEETVVEEIPDTPFEDENSTTNKSLWGIFILSFLGGFAALLTPCVFPMIPMTVSFFTKTSKTKASGIKNGILYGLSIIAIYVLLGTVVVAIFGADSLNSLSTNPWFNLFFALLLFVFAFSFMGAFEIVLPSKWVNAVDRKADKGGLIGIFFMAFALALVSFSCTGPIVGSLIVEAARNGGLAPVVGMFGFSLALAIPFALFAIFPGWLQSLPKSGGWLNSVKVVLGFLEFAFAFKFLSIADMVLDLHLLEREVFIAIWIAIFLGLALYLWGKIKLPHDVDIDRLPVGRFVLGTFVIAFVIYMIPGLWGAPVNFISGFPPPVNYAESPMGVGKTSTVEQITSIESNEVESRHIGPHGIPVFEDYDQALTYAKMVNKPLLIDFTGKGCTNCRKMEDNVWVKPEVRKLMVNDFVVASLFVDLREKLPVEEQYISEATGKKIRYVGDKWTEFQITRYNRNTQPFYVILDHTEKELIPGKGYDANAMNFENWLKKGLEQFRK